VPTYRIRHKETGELFEGFMSISEKEEFMKDYEAIISFNDIFTELAEETEFRVVNKLDELKKMLVDYEKQFC
jgi:hypothetical protein